MASKPLPDHSLLLKLFELDIATGILTYKPRGPEFFTENGRGGALGQSSRWNGRWAGKIAGYSTRIGYREVQIPILGGGYFISQQHRVVWCLTHGFWPESILDHINGIRGDNRPSNLRLSSLKLNARNMCLPSNNTSGFCGVSFNRRTGKWFAQIIADNKRHYLGTYDRKSDAIAARQEANARFGFLEGHGKPKIVQYPLSTSHLKRNARRKKAQEGK